MLRFAPPVSTSLRPQEICTLTPIYVAVESALTVLDGKPLDPGCAVNPAVLERVKGIEPSS